MADSRAPTTDQIRHDIDSGKSGDKVGFPDPSAAPLGTDDEAAGTPPTERQRMAAHAEEVINRPNGDPVATEPRPVSTHQDSTSRPRRTWLIAVLVGVVAAVAVVFWALSGGSPSDAG